MSGMITPAAKMLCVFVLVGFALQSRAIEISKKYKSPRSSERKVRKSTELIVLHTTEAPARSSLNKVSDRGECHYCVTEEGTIYAIVDRDREAFHAGRSMWKGKEDVDKFSIGIECVGYHDKAMSLVQLRAIRDLVKELKKMYRLTDDKVVTHSQVAYGMPNKWQKKKHRGRKRCGMLFAMPSVRAVLELKSRTTKDTDVAAKRLTVGDPELERILYGRLDTMKAQYPSKTTKAVASKSAEKPKTEVAQAKPPPAKPKPAAAQPKAVASKTTTKPKPATSQPKAVASKPAASTPKSAVAKKPASSAATTSKVASTKPKQQPPASTPPTSISELRSRGYVMLGSVVKGRTASQIAGAKWNAADTYYTIRNKVIPGNAINPAKIEVNMVVWRRQ